MIKKGNLQIDKFYLGDKSDAKIYLGDVKVWPKEEEPGTYPYAFQRVSRGGSAYTVDCNSTSSNTVSSADTQSGLTSAEINGSTSDKTPVSVVFGDGCKTIGDSACSGWTYLSSVTISDNVTSLGESSFDDTPRIEHLKIGSGITQLNQSYTFRQTGHSGSTKPDLDLSKNVGLNVVGKSNTVFSWCYFNNVILPKNCTLGTSSFDTCSASTLSFGSGTIILDGNDWPSITSVFNSCNISNIDLNGVTKIGNYAFYNLSGCTSITIPPSVTDFGTYAFSGVSSLNSVTIDYASNATLKSGQFKGCKSITSLTIGSHPTSIGGNMFDNCTKLTTLVIPSNISSIGGYAFYNCSGLTSITVESVTPPTLGSNAFYSIKYNCLIYVPPESVDAYKAASGWKDYASRIKAIPT